LIQSFDHTSFTVADVERAVAFWRDVMGFAVADLSSRDGDWLGAVVGVPGARCRIATCTAMAPISSSSSTWRRRART
jgi:lactoylglutathione lyase